jgi:DNA-binding NarL/FixJ family response regulator
MTENAKLKILLVDDHAVVREGLKTLINAEPDMEVIAEARDGREAIERSKDCDPDVVVMDLSMPRMGGVEATETLRMRCPEMKVLALTMHEDAGYLRSLLEAGASGYVLKRSAPQELVHALRSVAGGGTYIDPVLAGKMVGSFVQKPPLRGEIEGQDLSEREEAVLRLIAQGYTNKEIGAKLSISSKSVETYKARGMEKLALESRVDIVRYAVQRGWLQGV